MEYSRRYQRDSESPGRGDYLVPFISITDWNKCHHIGNTVKLRYGDREGLRNVALLHKPCSFSDRV